MLSSLALAAATDSGEAVHLIANLAVILCVAAVTTVVFQRLHQPVILGYLLAGVIVGPHLPVPLVASEQVAHTYSELGVILLMFALGLEFSLRKLARLAASSGLVAIIECSLMAWLGFLAGHVLGWSRHECLFTGALVSISSTTIIAKAFDEQKVTGRLTETVFGILIVEDLVAILLLAILTAIASGSGLSAGQVAHIAGRLGGWLAVVLVAGLLVVPRLIRLVVRVGRPETIVVASVGVCFAFALLAQRLGYSVALGAFVGGTLVAESGESAVVEPLVAPVRDVFAAIFFVAVGMQIDPHVVVQHAGAVVLLTVVVIVGKIVGVSTGVFLAGGGVRSSLQAGMSLAQIGEFSFIIAGVGVVLGATRSFLYPVAVAVSAVTTLVTPWLIRASGPVAAFVDRRLPHALQTYASLYGSWVQNLRAAKSQRPRTPRLRRMIGLLVLDVAVVAALVIAAATSLPDLSAFIATRVEALAPVSQASVLVVAAFLAAPFVLGTVRVARALGSTLALEALPQQSSGVDLAAAPRRGLIVGLQLTILVLVGIPFVAVVQPFVPFVPTVIALGAGILLLAIPFWATATDLEAHARAGAEVISELLAAQSRATDGATSGAARSEDALEGARHLIPGLGDPIVVHLVEGAPALGHTLKSMNLRGITGATVVALRRASGAAIVPKGDEKLLAGDVVVLAGAGDSVRAARVALVGETSLRDPVRSA